MLDLLALIIEAFPWFAVGFVIMWVPFRMIRNARESHIEYKEKLERENDDV